MKKNTKKDKEIRSKKRIKERNALKASRKALQGAKMLISNEEAKLREESGKRPILRKKWKEEARRARLEAQQQMKPVPPKDFYSEELKARREAKKAHLKDLQKRASEKFKLQVISYIKIRANTIKKLEKMAKFSAFIDKMKRDKKISLLQSKIDKAKHKASLAAFKQTYVQKKLSTTNTASTATLAA